MSGTKRGREEDEADLPEAKRARHEEEEEEPRTGPVVKTLISNRKPGKESNFGPVDAPPEPGILLSGTGHHMAVGKDLIVITTRVTGVTTRWDVPRHAPAERIKYNLEGLGDMYPEVAISVGDRFYTGDLGEIPRVRGDPKRSIKMPKVAKEEHLPWSGKFRDQMMIPIVQVSGDVGWMIDFVQRSRETRPGDCQFNPRHEYWSEIRVIRITHEAAVLWRSSDPPTEDWQYPLAEIVGPIKVVTHAPAWAKGGFAAMRRLFGAAHAGVAPFDHERYSIKLDMAIAARGNPHFLYRWEIPKQGWDVHNSVASEDHAERADLAKIQFPGLVLKRGRGSDAEGIVNKTGGPEVHITPDGNGYWLEARCLRVAEGLFPPFGENRAFHTLEAICASDIDTPAAHALRALPRTIREDLAAGLWLAAPLPLDD